MKTCGLPCSGCFSRHVPGPYMARNECKKKRESGKGKEFSEQEIVSLRGFFYFLFSRYFQNPLLLLATALMRS